MLEQLLGTKTKISILKTMEKHNRSFWLDDLVHITGLSAGTVYPALQDLEESRMLISYKMGRSKIYELNKSHILYNEIITLLKEEREKPLHIAKEFVKSFSKENIESILLFGSVVLEQFTITSDIDLLIVHSGDQDEIDENAYSLVDSFLKKYNIFISLTYVSDEDVKNRIKSEDPFFKSIKDQSITLFGDSLWQN